MAGHTPENAWKQCESDLIDEALAVLARFYGGRSEVNATRFLACFRACTGLPDAFLASGGIGRTLDTLRDVRRVITDYANEYHGHREDLLSLDEVRADIDILLSELPDPEGENVR